MGLEPRFLVKKNDYVADGVLIDLILPGELPSELQILEYFGGIERTKRRSSTLRVVIRKDNGHVVVAPLKLISRLKGS